MDATGRYLGEARIAHPGYIFTCAPRHSDNTPCACCIGLGSKRNTSGWYNYGSSGVRWVITGETDGLVGRILTVLAHPDDAEIWAGGTLAQHVRLGDEALICSLAGEPGSLRANEAGEGAQVLGAQVTVLKQADRHMRLSDELVNALANLLADYRPSVIVTHWELDAHPDHVLANTATRAAIVAASGLSQELEMVLACDTYLSSGRDGMFTPELYIDVSDVWETKLAAIRQHASQDPEYYVQTIERQCWLHGARAKVRYAEGFRRIPVYGRLGGALNRLGRAEPTTARKRTSQ